MTIRGNRSSHIAAGLRCLLAAAAMLAAGGAAHAQVPLTFDDVDWTIDRGQVTFYGAPAPINGIPLRLGLTNFHPAALANRNLLPGQENGNNPGPGAPRWVFPRTIDEAVTNPLGQIISNEIVDNPNNPLSNPLGTPEPAYPNGSNFQDSAGNWTRVQPAPPPAVANPATPVDPQQMAHAFWYPTTAAWMDPANPVDFNSYLGESTANGAALNDYRAPGGGFSFSTDPTQPYDFDYGFVFAIHDDFTVTRPDGTQSAASDSELASLPNAPSYVYQAVNTELINQQNANNLPIAIWSSGQYNLTPGRYGIDLYMPGSGTLSYTNNSSANTFLAHGSVSRVLVRVAWRLTVNPNGSPNWGTGQPNTGGINDPVNSRIFVVDEQNAGWVNITGGGQGAGSFPLNPNYNINGDQLVVVLYALTPDSLTDPMYGGPNNAIPPVVTADAIRFTPQFYYPPTTVAPLTTAEVQQLGAMGRIDPNSGTDGATSPFLWQISPSGTVMAAVDGTNKFTPPNEPEVPSYPGANGLATYATGTPPPPYTFLARNELTPDTSIKSLVNPTLPYDPTPSDANYNPQIADPTSAVSVPVFYCVDGRNSVDPGAPAMTNAPTGVPAIRTVNWQGITYSNWTYDSEARVIWRYVGQPDGGTGVESASGMIANVRCRDNKVRPMVYFVTSSAGGGQGHIYAFNPLGDPSGLTTNPQVYWTYPSIRPLTAAEVASNYPAQYEDPNYSFNPNLPPRQGNYPAFTFGSDISAPFAYFDGDLVPGAAGNPPAVRTDTQITVPGFQSSPILIDDQDPNNTLTAQVLILGGMDGRIYAFDGGGRGDFDPNNLATAGTTQRLWAWPHWGADAFHAALERANVGVAAWANSADTVQNQTGIGQIVSSPAFDPTYPLNQVIGQYRPLFIGGGATNGHLYAVNPTHDVLGNPATVNSLPNYANREQWQYPNNSVSLGDAVSTPAIFQPTNDPNRYLYFTCAGRLYDVPELPPGGVVSQPAVNALTWVYPYTPNPPNEVPTDSTTDPILPGTNYAPPVLLTAATAAGYSNSLPLAALPYDLCYVLAGNGTVIGVDAAARPASAPGGQTLVRMSGQSFTGSFAISPPMATLITNAPGLITGLNATGNQLTQPPANPDNPVITFADYDGNIWGLGTNPNILAAGNNGVIPIGPVGNPNQNGALANSALMPVLWYQQDSTAARTAGAALVGGDLFDERTAQEVSNNTAPAYPPPHGVIMEGDQGGQLRGYSVGYDGGAYGIGYPGFGNTLGASEPCQPSSGGSGPVSIDLRIVDFYSPTDWENFWGNDNGPGGESPAVQVTQNGQVTYLGAKPLAGNIDPKTNALAVDWGDYLYVAAWGVYYVPQGQSTISPTVQVTFTITQPGGRSLSPTITVPLDPTLQLPHDKYAPAAQYNIYANGSQQNNGIPFVAVYKIPIRPTGAYPFAPGEQQYSVSAEAKLTVNGLQSASCTGAQTATSMILMDGETNPGLAYSVFPIGANSGIQTSQQSGQTVPRRIFVTNPIALTLQGPGTNDGSYSPSAMANAASAIGFVSPLSAQNPQGNVQEVLGTRNTVTDPISNRSTNRSLFAPVGAIQPGASATYQVVNANGGVVPGLYAYDRSNVWGMTGQTLMIRVVPDPTTLSTTNLGVTTGVGGVQSSAAQTGGGSMRWHGDVTSVMNPLPWEQLPTDAFDSPDYPSIPTNDLSITVNGGQDATKVNVPLVPPTNNTTSSATRIPQPTLLAATVQVPQYQPANVNRGLINFNYQGRNYSFGSTYIDEAGNARGSDPGSVTSGDGGNTGPSLIGPLVGGAATQSGAGLPTAVGNALTFPAGGYIGKYLVAVIPPGQRSLSLTQPQNMTDRVLELGVSVPPVIRLETAEQTIDLGKLPAGAGFSDVNPSTNFYRYPFAPNGTDPGGANPAQVGGYLSPWDNDPTQTPAANGPLFGKFFHTFTLRSYSNINIWDPRIAKLSGIPGANIGADVLTASPLSGDAASMQFTSDQVDQLAITPLYGDPFGGPSGSGNAYSPGTGSIGIVSSLDHAHTYPNAASHAWNNEYPLWPIYDPYITGSNFANVQNLPQYVNDGLAFGANAWANAANQTAELHPTIHKPLVGDQQPTVATVPDVPRNYATDNTISQISGGAALTPAPTEIGIAIPPGTPAGTYSAPVYAYEDNTPIQWLEWLTNSPSSGPSGGPGGGGVPGVGANHDGILNVDGATGAVLEDRSNPTITVTATVRETRLTGGATPGSLSQIDPWNNTATVGQNMLPAVMRVPTPSASNVFLYWSTNRPAGGGAPGPTSPWSLAYTMLPAPAGDFNFGINGSQSPTPSWWGINGLPLQLYPGYQGGEPAGVANLFPSNPPANPGPGAVPYLAGVPNLATVRHASPAVAQAVDVSATGVVTSDPESYLVWEGEVQKVQQGSAAPTTVTDSRTFYTSLVDPANATPPGVPTGQTLSFLNDPALTKLGPRPLLLKLASNGNAPAEKLLYLFWYAGTGNQTTLYYNVNVADQSGIFNPAGWQVLGDQQLPLPNGLSWQSDPYPVYRRVTEIVNGQPTVVDAIDLVYNGVLKNRKAVEVLLSRFYVNRVVPQPGSNAPAVGTLSLAMLPPVMEEPLARQGAANTWQARDAGWYVGVNANSNNSGFIEVDLLRNGSVVPLNLRSDGQLQQGKLDPASGLLYFDMVGRDRSGNQLQGAAAFGGGEVVVDPKSGTVTFPNVTPLPTDSVLASYVPQVMRINTSRDTRLVDLADPSYTNGPFNNDASIAAPAPAITSSGNNYDPIVLMDRAVNPRYQLTSPNVVFPQGTLMPVDRMWLLYRKSDASATARGTIYYKPMRLMAKLPRPVPLGAVVNQAQQFAGSVTVAAGPLGWAPGPYEVDWIRGRVYFTEQDEGNQVAITFPYQKDNSVSSPTLIYTIGWEDEASAAGTPGQSSIPLYDPTVPEVAMPIDTAVNEGQVAAFLDPFPAFSFSGTTSTIASTSKVWVFWTSTRSADQPAGAAASTTPVLQTNNEADIYYETLAPQLYPTPTVAH